MNCGVLRGHWHYCPHDVEHTPPQLSHPNSDTYQHAVTLATTWNEVLEYIIEPHMFLPRPMRPRPQKPSNRFHRSFLNDLYSKTSQFRGDDVVYTMQYFWTYCRSGIFVSIRNGKMELFVPFCNPDYCNNWPPEVHNRFVSHRGSLPKHMWWTNGWLLCDQLPPDICGDHWFTTIRDMVMKCCKVDRDFIINKRDCPLVRKDCGDPLNPFTPPIPVVDYSRMIRVFSFYGAPSHVDIPCPIARDWHRLCHVSFSQAKPVHASKPFVDMYWESKEPKVIFRGSLTGTGQRELFCNTQFRNCDAGCTGLNNNRRKIHPVTLHECKPRACMRFAERISLDEQQQNYKYALLLNGHSGADRLLQLLNGSQVLLIPQPCKFDLGTLTWASPMMYPMQHYVPIQYDGADLDDVVDKLESTPGVNDAIRASCACLPIDLEAIREWWWHALL